MDVPDVEWLLGANVLSELRKGDRADPGVREWFVGTNEETLFTRVLVLGEIRGGIESIRRRDLPSALALEQWLLRMSQTLGDHVLPVSAAVADRWGVMNVPDPIPTIDGLLAATALVHDLKLVRRIGAY